MVEYKEVLDILAPCGLNCRQCFANSGGEIRLLSSKLRDLLGLFHRNAEKFSSFLPIFRNYPAFAEILRYLGQGNCDGCRKGTCGILPNCGVYECYHRKGVDFCFQCEEFPCDKTNFGPELKAKWIQINNRMKQIGAVLYLEETKDLPRYR